MSISYPSSTSFEPRPLSEEVPIIRTAYGPKLRQSVDFNPDLDRTSQEFKEECDINSLMEKYRDPQLIPFQNTYAPQYGDVTGLEFSEMQERILEAKTMFADLPAKIRKRFNNNPADFLDFFNDPENAAEAAALGLLKPETDQPVPTPTPEVKTPQNGSNEPTPKTD